MVLCYKITHKYKELLPFLLYLMIASIYYENTFYNGYNLLFYTLYHYFRFLGPFIKVVTNFSGFLTLSPFLNIPIECEITRPFI